MIHALSVVTRRLSSTFYLCVIGLDQYGLGFVAGIRVCKSEISIVDWWIG